ncbi:MAG: alpha/beta fold hydrolase [Bacteroidales bacterium]|nr:alpha/beta fold hydrolase [Bacteroidales bacterium]
MKKTALILISLIVASVAYAQDITGQWNGLLKIQGTQLGVVLHISKSGSGYIITMDSPDQGAKDVPALSVSFEKSILKIEVAGGIYYQGTLTQDNQIVGELRQSTFTLPLTFTRSTPEKEKIVRPQDPVKPYPYDTEEVSFKNPDDGAVLAGTLSLPSGEGVFPVVVLITGSGPQNRDEELMGHKPFLVLADYLTRKGIAVLRYDDRGTAKSTGDFQKASSPVFAADVEAAINYLLTRKDIDKKKIGLIGHSEGGMIAPMVAAKNKDVSYLVLMAGTGIRGKELLLLQQELIGRANGQTAEQLAKVHSDNQGAFDLILNSTNQETLKKALNAYILKRLKDVPADQKPAGVSDEAIAKQQMDQITSPWFQYFLKYDPSLVLSKVKCPVLALNGAKDLQVPPRENLSAIKSGLEKGGNKKVTVREFPNLNHLFQECETGSPNEYGQIQQTISPQVLDEISEWILRQTK